MSIQSIRAFAAVVQQGSFAGAPELLKVSQPTATQHSVHSR
ncbi:LysR family transcriptional regulator [Salinispora vitiensis]|nr:LysR family transcriptional regulator [Salinispora vitiensis]